MIGKCLYILRPFAIFIGDVRYFMTIWYIFPVLVSCTKKNLATLLGLRWKATLSPPPSLTFPPIFPLLNKAERPKTLFSSVFKS
jgi:hypothetical protein